MFANFTPAEYTRRMVASGFPFECTCGDYHKTPEAAVTCGQCRRYMADEPRTATDLRTGKVQTHGDVFPPQPVPPEIRAQVDRYFAGLSD